ncbi:unnamed protein product [Schistosoma margrebowiei]|uniref:Uncharacterized protein n=1 Tax=Schistosoma margrebowiei TaxID=48269 RepID=A0A3P7ZBR1_9TREM|nr:unnamed protein product [Schistosoma margrebowiei]
MIVVVVVLTFEVEVTIGCEICPATRSHCKRPR